MNRLNSKIIIGIMFTLLLLIQCSCNSFKNSNSDEGYRRNDNQINYLFNKKYIIASRLQNVPSPLSKHFYYSNEIPINPIDFKKVEIVKPNNKNERTIDINPEYIEVFPNEITIYSYDENECTNSINGKKAPNNAIYINAYNKAGELIQSYQNNDSGNGYQSTLNYSFCIPTTNYRSLNSEYPIELKRNAVPFKPEEGIGDPLHCWRVIGHMVGTHSVTVTVAKGVYNPDKRERLLTQGQNAVKATFIVHVKDTIGPVYNIGIYHTNNFDVSTQEPSTKYSIKKGTIGYLAAVGIGYKHYPIDNAPYYKKSRWEITGLNTIWAYVRRPEENKIISIIPLENGKIQINALEVGTKARLDILVGDIKKHIYIDVIDNDK